MCSGHAMSLRHDGLDLGVSDVSSFKGLLWVYGHRLTYILWVYLAVRVPFHRSQLCCSAVGVFAPILHTLVGKEICKG